MNLIYVGELVNTHGIKGEVRLISNFKYKKEVFKIGNIIYINDKEYKINSYRVHKMFDMLTLEGINSIDDAIPLKGSNVYINKDNYTFSGVLNEDLIGMDVYDNDIYKGKVVEILEGVKYDLLVIDGIKRHMVPNIPEFIKNIDLDNNKIDINYIKGLDDEN